MISALHMREAWQSLMCSVKTALKAMNSERIPADKLMHSLLVECEMLINSQPLTYLEPGVHKIVSTDHFSSAYSNLF